MKSFTESEEAIVTEPTSPSESPAPTPGAGWYPDMNMPGSHRYYDGANWTSHVRPSAAVTAVGEPPRGAKSRNVLGIVALIVSVVGFVFACVPGALVVGWVLLPIGFVLGIVAICLKNKPKWQGLAAIIVSMVGTIVGVVVFLSLAAGAVSDAIDDSATDKVGSSDAVGDRADDEEQPADGEPVTPDAKALVLGETAFGIDIDSGMGWYAIELTNPNDDYIFSFAGIDVEAYDADDVLIDTDSTYGTILSGRTYIVGKFFDIGSAKIDRIEVRGPTADAATHSPAAETGSFEMGKLRTGSEYDEYMTVKGTLTSNFSEDQDGIRIDVIARKGGKIVGVDYTYTDRVPSGGKAAWDIGFWKVPLDSEVEAYPHL